MIILSELFTKTIPLQKKAPRNTMYQIDAIFISNGVVSAGGEILVLDRQVALATTTLDVNKENVVSMITTDAIHEHFVNTIDHKTKYITIGNTISGTPNCRVIVYGSIVRASRKELLIEWFRKR